MSDAAPPTGSHMGTTIRERQQNAVEVAFVSRQYCTAQIGALGAPTDKRLDPFSVSRLARGAVVGTGERLPLAECGRLR